MIKVNCDRCGAALEVDASASGKLVQCPSCGKAFMAGGGPMRAPAPLDFGGDDRITPDAPLPGSRPGIIFASPPVVPTLQGLSGGPPPGLPESPRATLQGPPKGPSVPPPIPGRRTTLRDALGDEAPTTARVPPTADIIDLPAPKRPPGAPPPVGPGRPLPPPAQADLPAPRGPSPSRQMPVAMPGGFDFVSKGDVITPTGAQPRSIAGPPSQRLAPIDDLPAPRQPSQTLPPRAPDLLDLPSPVGPTPRSARPSIPSMPAVGPAYREPTPSLIGGLPPVMPGSGPRRPTRPDDGELPAPASPPLPGLPPELPGLRAPRPLIGGDPTPPPAVAIPPRPAPAPSIPPPPGLPPLGELPPTLDGGNPLDDLPSLPPPAGGSGAGLLPPPPTGSAFVDEAPEAEVDISVNEMPFEGQAATVITAASPEPPRRGKLRTGRVALLGGAVVVVLALVVGALAAFTNILGGGGGGGRGAGEARRLLGDDSVATYKRVVTIARALSDENPKNVEARCIEAQAHFGLALAGVPNEGSLGEKRMADFGTPAPDDPLDLIKARALRALVAGNIPDASRWLKAVVDGGSGDALTHTYLGWIALRTGRSTDAQFEFKQALSKSHDQPAALYGLARSLEMSGTNDPAIHAYHNALNVSPERVGAVVAIERLQPSYNPTAAEKQIVDLITKKGADAAPVEVAEAWVLLAERAFAAGRNGEAEDRYRRALALDATSVPAKVGLARLLCDGDHVGQALPMLDDALKRQPKNLEALYGMVQAQVLDKHVEAADSFLKQAAAIAPKASRTIYWQGRLEEVRMGEGFEAHAAKFYQDAIAADPRFIDAYVMLSNLYRVANPAQARATLEKAEAQAADDPPLRNKLGEVYLALGDAPRAESYFHKVIDKAPTYYKARMNLAATLEVENKLDEADNALGDLEKLQKGYPGLAERRASLAVKRQRLEDADKLYDQALAESQPRASLLVAAANVSFRLAQYDKAKKHFAEAVVDDPRSAVAHLGLARIALVLSHGDEASYEARRSLAITDTGEAHLAMGQAAELLGRGDVAKDEYTVAAKGPTEFEARMGLARLLVRAGAVQDALTELGRVVKLDKTRADPYVLVGDCYEELAQHDKSTKAYEEATRRDLKNGEAAFKLGRNYKEAGKHGVAADLLERAMKLGTEQSNWLPEACLLAGDTRREGKQIDAAVRDYKRYLEVAPKYAPERKDIQKEIDRLEGKR